MIITISESVKKGFLRAFAPFSQRVEPLSHSEAQKQDREAILSDWRAVGDAIRSATGEYRTAK